LDLTDILFPEMSNLIKNLVTKIDTQTFGQQLAGYNEIKVKFLTLLENP